MLKKRVFTAVISLPVLVLLIVYSHQIVWDLFATFLICLCAIEWCALCGYGFRKKIYFTSSLVLSSLLVAGFSYLGSVEPIISNTLDIIILTSVMASIALVPLWVIFRWKVEVGWVVGFVGWVLFFSFWWSSVVLKGDPVFLIGILGLIFVSDTTAYFSGRLFGRTPLAPAISPKKTWEGVIGALLGVFLYSLIIILPLDFSGQEKIQMLVAAVMLMILGIFGDLFISLLKRQAGKKDTGRLLPGHGGVLDRIDSLMLSIPFAFTIINIGI